MSISKTNISERYVLVVEYIRKPDSHSSVKKICHGWVSYQSGSTEEKIRESFSSLDELPEIIRSMLFKDETEH